MKYRDAVTFGLLFISGLLFYCYEFYLRLLTGAYEKQIVHYFNISSHLSFSFLISSYNIVYLLMQIPAGILLDRFGSRKILVVATLICGLGNVVFTLHNYDLALLGRLLVGLGSSFAFVGVLKISREYLPSQFFGLFASIIISLGTLAAAFSQQISVLLLSYNLSWIRIFIYSGIASIPLSLLFYFALCSPPKNTGTLIMPNLEDVRSSVASLIKNKFIWLNSLWGGLLYVPTVIITSQYGVLYFQSLYNVTAYTATEAITILLMGWVVCSPLVSYFVDITHQAKFVVITSGLLLIFTLFALTYLPLATSRGNSLLLLVFLFGCFSSCQVLVWHVFNKICPKNHSAIGIAITNMIITGVTEIGQLSSGLMLDWHEGLSKFSVLTGFSHPMQFEAMLFFVSVLTSIVMLSVLSHKINRQVLGQDYFYMTSSR